MILENLLEESIRATDEIPPPFQRAVVRDPWLAASALQKSIRWGATEDALLAAHTLLEIRPDRLWRRLAIIALEDVGLGDLDLVAQVVWVSGKQAWRRDHGGDWRIAAHLIQRLAAAPKSRDACDVLVIAGWHRALDDARLRFFGASTGELIETVSDDRVSLPVRALAAWYLAGTANHPGENLPLRKGRYADLAEVYADLQVSPEVLQTAGWGAARTREAIVLPLIWLEYRKSTWCEVRSEPLPDPVHIGGWPAAAWDMHTRSGKRALGRFAKECPALHHFLQANVPQAERLVFVCRLVFLAEGGRLNRRLTYQGADALLQMAQEAQLCGPSLPFEAVLEAAEIVRSNLDQLHAIRRDFVPGRLAGSGA